MKAIINIVKQRNGNNNYIVQYTSDNDSLLNYFGKNGMKLKKDKENIILKIRLKRKFQFLRITLKPIEKTIWYGKSNDSEDLIMIQKTESPNSDLVFESYEIFTFQNHWRYRLLILSLINSNVDIISIYNKLV